MYDLFKLSDESFSVIMKARIRVRVINSDLDRSFWDPDPHTWFSFDTDPTSQFVAFETI